MKDIELPPLPDADVTNNTNLLGYRYSYSAIAMQAYARAAIEADRAQRVPDCWVQVTQQLLNSQEPWLYKPCWLAFPSWAVAQGVYEWRQGRNPDRFFSVEVGDVWAFDVSHVMPISTPPHPSKAVLASTPAPSQQEPAKPMDAHRAAYFMRRFLHEEKMLGPNEQAALQFTIAALEALESAQHQEQPAPAPPQQEPNKATIAQIDREIEAMLTLVESGSFPEFPERTLALAKEVARQIVGQHQEPPQQERKPMTDAEIEDLCGEANRGFCIELEDYKKAVQDTERHHGIRE